MLDSPWDGEHCMLSSNAQAWLIAAALAEDDRSPYNSASPPGKGPILLPFRYRAQRLRNVSLVSDGLALYSCGKNAQEGRSIRLTPSLCGAIPLHHGSERYGRVVVASNVYKIAPGETGRQPAG